jgi:threonine/homoserine efflux transporter RhtA
VSEFIDSGRILDVIAALLLLEGVLLGLYRYRTGRGIEPLGLFLSLGAGAGLVLAARAVEHQASWTWVAAALLLALVTHVGDLWRRWNT